MLLYTPKNGSVSTAAGPLNLLHEPPRWSEDIDSTCSTPYVSAPSSPGHGSSVPSGYFFSAPASPMHFLLSKGKDEPFSSKYEPVFGTSESGSSFEFEFCSRLSLNGLSGNGSMSSAEDLFLNGKIRPMKLSSHLQMPQVLVPLEDLDGAGDECSTSLRGRDLGMRNPRYAHRKTRSMSPFRTTQYEFHSVKNACIHEDSEKEKETEAPASEETTPSVSASSSRSSSTGRNNSKKWMFLKDLLHRSKSEGRANSKDRFWSAISFSPAKEQSPSPAPLTSMTSTDKKRVKNEMAETQKQRKGKKVPATGKPANGVWKRRVPPSAHELHYTSNRAQAEEMKKKTFLPYRQGLLGFLGFSSKNYGTFNGPTRTPNPVSSG
ncbi:Hypothetical predicted protein [Olea europaea subsp. europaea]|uniref:Uncharacterized protein n=1 Tax=Olea europaea subsp. europaea TaxID=158383 RepID=A0A8S0STG6_OLEEU|nr:Hypothetical predicted protein [Olea europaea subsp. europaea]